MTCANGHRTRILPGSLGSKWSPQIWPSRSELACRRISITPSASLIRSTWTASRSAAWTRCDTGADETLGHRGRKDDPLYKIRKLLLTGSERLNERGRDRMLLSLRTGDPNHEVVGAWLAKESVRDVYLAGNHDDAALVLDKAIAGCHADDVAEIRSLGNRLAAWRTEILAHHTTGASNGPIEGLNRCVKKVKRCGHVFRRFDNYRLRVLLHTGGVTCPNHHHHHASDTLLTAQMRRATYRAGRLSRSGRRGTVASGFSKSL